MGSRVHMPPIGILVSLALLVATALAALPPPARAILPGSGASGFAWRINNRHYSWLVGSMKNDSPHMLCHVEKIVDGSPPWGWGGAQVQWTAGGPWIELSVCQYVDGAANVRANSWSTLVLRDPALGPREDEPNECDCEMGLGGQMWVRGPDDPGTPPPEDGSPVAVAKPDTTLSQGPFEYVIDYEDPSGITRITNSPLSQGIVVARALIGPDPVPRPLGPGQSILYAPTGEVLGPGTIMVRSRGDAETVPGGVALLEYDIFNLAPYPILLDLWVEDAAGWEMLLSATEVEIPPMGVLPVAVTVAVPDTAAAMDGVALYARERFEPIQWHSDMAHILAARDWATHDVGNCALTMTDRGIIGFMDGSQTAGAGFIYPAGGSNQLYIGSVWLGLDPARVLNRDYDADPAKEWAVDGNPDGHVWIEHGGLSDQDIHAGFDDAGAAMPCGICAEQVSCAFASPPAADDFVIVMERFHNRGADPILGAYIGLYMDFDLGASAYDDGGRIEPALRAATMTDPSGLATGIAILDGGDPTLPPANLTLVHNPTFVWPNAYMLDPDKHAFLAASDAAHILPEAFEPNDYSILVSIGPISLAPQDSIRVAFAVAGGLSREELLANLRTAQLVYDLGPADVSDRVDLAGRAVRMLPPQPNPFSDRTTIHLLVEKAGPVRIEAFDVAGRRVGLVQSGFLAPGKHAFDWTARSPWGSSLPSGIYWIRMRDGAGSTESRPVIFVRDR